MRTAEVIRLDLKSLRNRLEMREFNHWTCRQEEIGPTPGVH